MMEKILLPALFFCVLQPLKAQEKPAFYDQVRLMAEEQDPQKNVLALHSIVSNLKIDTIKSKEQLDVLKGEVALSYLRNHDYAKFEEYVSLISNKFNQTSYLNMAAENLLRNKIELNYARVLAEKTVTLYDAYKNDPSARPAEFAARDWKRFMTMAAYPYYDTFAQALYVLRNYKLALFYHEQALKNISPEEVMQPSLERYTELLIHQGEHEKAYCILLKNAGLGNLSLRIVVGNKECRVFGN